MARIILAENMGIRGEWVRKRGIWDSSKYVFEQDYGDGKWVPETKDNNVVSIKYIGGPKDGQVDW